MIPFFQHQARPGEMMRSENDRDTVARRNRVDKRNADGDNR